MKEITAVKAFTQELEIVHLPASRIIGVEVRNGGKLGNTAIALWDQVYETEQHTILEKLPHVVGKDLLGWTCDYDPATQTFSYIVCCLTPAGTSVPEGFAYRDVPETLCAIGMYGENVDETLKRVKEAGYVDAWSAEGCGWNAEYYFAEEEKNPPKSCSMPWHWLVPIKKA